MKGSLSIGLTLCWDIEALMLGASVVLVAVGLKRNADLSLMDLADEKGVRRVSGVPLADRTPSLDGLEPLNPCLDILTCLEK
jgi:hypothetical protein